jgi:undecaprenyl-diphosphatase
MNEFLLAAILGVVEGITEFLPVSSTAHLRVTQHLLGLSLESEFWKMFAIVIQLGAILAVVVHYRAKLIQLSKEKLKLSLALDFGGMLRHPTGLVAIAFFCTVIPAFLLKKVIGENLESLRLMAFSLIVGGVVMALVEWLFRNPRTHSLGEMKPWQAAFVGLVQVLSAVFPGTSRSMSTIAGGQIAGLSRAAALEFSFLVSIPVMLVATSYDFLKYVKAAQAAGSALLFTGRELALVTIGFVVSFIVAYAVIAWFLGYVRKHGFLPFAIYRIAAGLAIFFSLIFQPNL